MSGRVVVWVVLDRGYLTGGNCLAIAGTGNRTCRLSLPISIYSATRRVHDCMLLIEHVPHS